MNTESVTWQRTSRTLQMTNTVYNLESLLLSLLRAHQARVHRLKCSPTGLVYWALGFFFLLTSQFSGPVSVATSGTSSLDEEVFSTALQSNGNDCAPGETENCIWVLEWIALMRLRGEQCMGSHKIHFWISYQKIMLHFRDANVSSF